MLSAITKSLGVISKRPAVLASITSKLGLKAGADVLGTIRAHLAAFPGSAATIATIVAMEAPDLMRGIIASADDKGADQLLDLISNVSNSVTDPDAVMGDRQPGYKGLSSVEVLKSVDLVNAAVKRVETIAGILGIRPNEVDTLVSAIQDLEPEDGAIYRMTRG